MLPVAALLLTIGARASPPQGTCAARRLEAAGRAAEARSRPEAECKAKLEANRTEEAMRCMDGFFTEFREPGRFNPEWRTSLRKIRHDVEMFEWLAQQGKVGVDVSLLYRTLWQGARRQRTDRFDEPFSVDFHEDSADRRLFGKVHNKAVYIDKAGTSTPATVVGAAPAALAAAEQSFVEDGFAVVDKILTKKTHKALTRFLQASTFYFFAASDRHVIAALEEGLASPLLGRISDALRASLPSVLGPLPLTGAAAWKADNSKLAYDGPPPTPDWGNYSGDAEVSVLIWPVSQNALNGTVLDALQFRSKDSGSGATGPADAKGARRAAAKRSVKYASNRVVLWASHLEATWAGPHWRGPGFLDRGIHLLLTYGWTKCPA